MDSAALHWHGLPEMDISARVGVLSGFWGMAGGREGLLNTGGGDGLHPRLRVRGLIGGGQSVSSAADCDRMRSLFISACWNSDGAFSSSCKETSWERDWAGLRVGPTGGERDREDSELWWELVDMRLACDGDTDSAGSNGIAS